ncbi:enoyl-CoA hydratase [Rhodococcus sp. ACS1]|uniref:Enoyl-CoA hydratase/carnithine racemase n=1 Tax=Rhodococcus koreensis TaxID=99653 RepID=A0A1H4WAD3_9NOCA|nr:MULTISPECIES: crotonase/enoyl-CoA hydratase family protein [Rhodococcus]PBC49891.1 enoyl-CoA hydratase [Rhodococcus sp. ACS1]SEC90050.1 Enoyl-CoA hydratase/carnithine racemase [Rhodococcus koreensis]
MKFNTIRLEVDDGIATITLDRPDQLNACTTEMKSEIIEAFDHTDASDAVRVVIMTGSGRAFCAGADLSGGGSRFDAPEETDGGVPRDGGGEMTLRIYDSTKPVIAAINGPAVGVGATITLPMDIRLASEGAKFAFPFTRRGIIPESCSSWFLPRLVGVERAVEWLYTGRLFTAAEAHEGGLISAVHPPETLLAAARSLAAEIIDNTAPVSVTLTRQLVWRMLGAAHPMDAHIAESRGMRAQGASSDAYEGVTAFLEKRPPRFTRKVTSDLPDIFPGWVRPGYR